MACMSRVLQRRHTSSLGQACQKDLEVETLFMREASECMELCLGMDDELSESLWAQIREQTSTGDIVVSEHLLQHTWPGNQVDEALYGQGAATSYSQAPVLVREDLNHSGMGRKDNPGRSIQSTPRETDKFLTQVIKEPTVGHSVLDLIITKKEGLLGDMKITDSLKLQ